MQALSNLNEGRRDLLLYHRLTPGGDRDIIRCLNVFFRHKCNINQLYLYNTFKTTKIQSALQRFKKKQHTNHFEHFNEKESPSQPSPAIAHTHTRKYNFWKETWHILWINWYATHCPNQMIYTSLWLFTHLVWETLKLCVHKLFKLGFLILGLLYFLVYIFIYFYIFQLSIAQGVPW